MVENPPPEGAFNGVSERTGREGQDQVAYGAIPSPIGDLAAVVTRRGLLALAFEAGYLETLLQRVATRISPDILRLPSAVAGVRSWLDTYFSGQLEPAPRLDRSLLTPFQDRVLTAAASIPAGEVRTYGQVAVLAGNPKAARATGRALGANPIPIVLPCHRVVAADGRLHGYAGGLDRKRFLLAHESSLMGSSGKPHENGGDHGWHPASRSRRARRA